MLFVSVRGEIDLATAPDLMTALHGELERETGTVVLELVLGGCSPAVLRVLDLTETRSLFT